jgi:hypothetical protein
MSIAHLRRRNAAHLDPVLDKPNSDGTDEAHYQKSCFDRSVEGAL